MTEWNNAKQKQMKRIPKTYRRYGYDFELVERTEIFDTGTAVCAVAIYVQKYEGGIVGYEVHKVRSKTTRPTAKSIVKWEIGDEYLATVNEFGRYAWAIHSLDTAKRKAQAVIDGAA